MPKQLFKIKEFDGGVNTATAENALKPGETPYATNVDTGSSGRLRVLGNALENYIATVDFTGVADLGYGLFTFAHDYDMICPGPDYTGADDTSATHATRMTDSTAAFPASGLIGLRIINVTDGSTGIITANAETTVDVVALTGGSDDYWTDGDLYSIGTSDIDSGIGRGKLVAVPLERSTNYLCKATANGVAIYDFTNKVWYDSAGSGAVTNIITFSTSDILPIYYLVDGALRVCDSNPVHVNEPIKWLGHIKRTLFVTSDTPLELNQWFSDDANVWRKIDDEEDLDPTNGIFTVHKNVEAAMPGNITSCINAHYDFVDDPAEVATWTSTAKYDLYVTPLFDDTKQEGQMLKLTTMGSPTSTSSQLLFGVTVTAGAAFANFNKRITGCRFYVENTNDSFGSQYMLCEVDLVKGCRKGGGAQTKDWHLKSGTTYESHDSLSPSNCFIYSDPPVGSTYDSNNGHYHTEETKASYRTATVVGRRVYVGAVAMQNGDTPTGSRMVSDMLLKTPANQFDKFPEMNRVIASTNDGDEIVKLVNFGGKLLQFKKNNMYVINVDGDLEKIETKYSFMGISKPYHMVETALGIFWINKSGLHWYSGEKISNLIDNKLAMRTWDFTDNFSLGFDDKNKKLLIAKNLLKGQHNSKDMWIFDLKKMTWMPGSNIIDGTGDKTNFVNTPDGELIYAIDGTEAGYATLALTNYYVLYQFEGGLVQYNASPGDMKIEYGTTPWLLNRALTDGVKDINPPTALNVYRVNWDGTKFRIMASTNNWKDANDAVTDMTTEFDPGERFTISGSDVPEFNRTWYRREDPTGDVAEANIIISFYPSSQNGPGGVLNFLRDIVRQIVAQWTFTGPNAGAGTLEHLVIEADDTNKSSGIMTIDIGDVRFTLSDPTYGDGDVSSVHFVLTAAEGYTQPPSYGTDHPPLVLAGGSLMKWTEEPADTGILKYYTQDLDFGDIARDKKISRIYVTFKSLTARDGSDEHPITVPSYVKAQLPLKTSTGEYTVAMNADHAATKNYTEDEGFVSTSGSNEPVKATLIPSTTDVNEVAVPAKVISAQLVLYNDAEADPRYYTPGGFEVIDISFSFRMRTVR